MCGTRPVHTDHAASSLLAVNCRRILLKLLSAEAFLAKWSDLRCFPEKINDGQFYTLPNFRHNSPSGEWAPRVLWGLSGPGSRLAAARAQSGPPLPPTGAVPAHHHPHHERRGQALRLPLRLPHLPVFLHDDTGHPLLKLLHSGMFKLKQSRAKHETERLCVMVLISPVKHYGSAGL